MARPEFAAHCRQHLCSCRRIRMPLLLLLAAAACLPSGVSATFDVWMGSAPFCSANPSSCHMFDLEYVRSDSKGSGSKCLRGTKVLCRPKLLEAKLTETPKNELIVAVYNVNEVPFSIAHEGQTERTCHVPRALLNKFPDVDVVIFNELFIGGCLQSGQGDRYVSMKDLMELHGFIHSTYIVGESTRAFYSINGGTAIMSRWPIIDTNELIYTHYSSEDRFRDKGAIHAKVVKEGAIYHVIGTHMQDRDSEDDVRMKQAEELRRFILDLALPDTEPVIIGGDLNCDRLNKPKHAAEVLKAMQVAVPTITGEARATYDYANNNMVPQEFTAKEWLDYAVYSIHHKQPGMASMEAYPLKADTGIKFCSSATLQPYYVPATATMCGAVKETKDLSSHFPVIGRFSFNDN